MSNKDDDIRSVQRFQPTFTNFEVRLINAKRNKTGESGSSMIRRIMRMYLLGELKQKDNETYL